MTRFIIFAASCVMAGSTRVILIIASAAILVDCRLRGKFNQQQKKVEDLNTVVEQKALDKIKTISDADHVVPGDEKTRDSDAIVFPSDDDFRIYPDVSKIVSETLSAEDINKHSDLARITTNTPLLPKVVPSIEAKEAFTNPVPLDGFTIKTIDIVVEDNVKTSPKPIHDPEEAKIAGEAKQKIEHGKITHDNNITEVENISNDKSNSNETTPDFKNRFGESGNYMLVPVNNVQTYQPIQANLQSNTDHGLYDQGNNPNTNIGDNSQYLPQNTNIVQNSNANNNGNSIPQGTNYVPITVSNTYMINGQLYAALTIPNNMNVPNSIYLINPQLPQSGYQVANNLPVYKLVQGDQGSNVNNAQYVIQ